MSLTCSLAALERAEPLLGTAGRGIVHLVMALPKREWLPRAEDLPGPMGELARLAKTWPDQVQFSLRNSLPEESGEVWLFPHRLCFSDLVPEHYERLLEQALSGEIHLPHTPLEAQYTILVCTHGKRDACCAEHGTPVFRALQEAAPPEVDVYEVSHLGGIVLPRLWWCSPRCSGMASYGPRMPPICWRRPSRMGFCCRAIAEMPNCRRPCRWPKPGAGSSFRRGGWPRLPLAW
ncbi:MAG: hypothetical protein HC915_08545 [Anaerolineae bacterium]|nr:hypothetical protein [Anaerolineae bacterium]